MKKAFNLICCVLLSCVFWGIATARIADAAKRDDINISLLANLSTSDPHASRLAQDTLFFRQVYEPLITQNELSGEFEFLVAQSYSVSDDGLTYTFKLRPKIKFHNGDFVKASDVAFSIMREKDMIGGVGFADAIKKATPVDDETVNIVLNKKSAAFLTNLSQLYILSEREVKEQGEAFGTKVNRAGTGPYYLTYLDRAVKWDCERFEEYYRGVPAIKYLHYKPIVDAAAGLITFESGELDWYIAPIADWDALVKNEKYNTELVISNHVTYIMVNWLRGPLANDKLRLAIAYALDKEAMNIAAFDGHAEIANFMERPGVNVGAPSEGITYSYDPKKARELVIEAGYEKGVDIGTIVTMPGTYFEKVAQVMQANLADVGIKSQISLVETNAAITMGRKQEFDIETMGHASLGDYENLRRFVHSSAAGSYFIKFEGNKFDYKRIDELFDRASQELDPVKRKQIYKEANDLLMKTCCLLPVLHKAQPFVWAKALKIPKNYPNNPQIFEWSWGD
ncbi:MAG: ABC transporter substrate-binding protein [Synergistaceae bacterium]|jgi:peptide/nickel transport system substrate-binding protein|nr:ABC transporter substrate-binding protein [Synergistaceae bacterium]